MFSEQWLVDLIIAETGYFEVELAEDTGMDQFEEEITLGNPRVTVGHLGIGLQKSQDFIFDTFHEIDNAEVLTTEIKFLCLREELPQVRAAIKTAYTGKSPYPADEGYGTIGFLGGKVVAKTNTKIVWQETVGFIMPRIS